MKKYLIGGLVLATMFTGISCGSKAQEITKEQSNLLEEAKVAVASSDYSKARNLFKLASNETEGEDKINAISSYELLSTFILAEKATDEKNIEQARVELEKIENDATYTNLVEDIKKLKSRIEAEEEKEKKLDEILENISSLLNEKKLDEAKKTFEQINLEELTKAGNKKYADMSIKIKALEEKIEAKKLEEKELEKQEQKVKEEEKKKQNQLLNASNEIYIDYDDTSSEDEFESYKFDIQTDSNLKVETITHKSYASGVLRKIEENKWTGTLYDSANLTDQLCDVVVTDDVIKVIGNTDKGTFIKTLYIKSKTYKSEFTLTDENEPKVYTGSFNLK